MMASFIGLFVAIFAVLFLGTNQAFTGKVANAWHAGWNYVFPDPDHPDIPLMQALAESGMSIGIEYFHENSEGNDSTPTTSVVVQENTTPSLELAEGGDLHTFELVKNKTYHSMEKLLAVTRQEELPLTIDVVPWENRIIIPRIEKNIPLIDVKNRSIKSLSELDKIFMKELENGIVRYPGSARPGEVGNSFIFGHSSNFWWAKGDYNDVFARINDIEIGDEVIVYYGQKQYIYRIKEKEVIKPGDISILSRDENKKEMTIMTCWPIGTTQKRMIVIWELVE